MNDPVDTDITIDLTDAETGTAIASVTDPPPAKRGRMRWYHIVVLGVSVLVCAAAVGFFTSQSSDRDDATAERRAARADMVEQRDDTGQTRTGLERERTETKSTLADVDQLTTSFQALTDLMGQEVDVLAELNQLAVSSPDAANEINAKLAQAANLLDQLEAKAHEVEDLAKELQRRTEAQYAAAVSKR